MSAGLVPPVQGSASVRSILRPHTVRPIDMAVSLDYRWKFDPFQYANETSLLAAGWFFLGAGTSMFALFPGRMELTSNAAIGGMKSIQTSQQFAIGASINEDDLFWRARVKNQVGAGKRLAFVGFQESNPDGQLTLETALNQLKRFIGFVHSEDLEATNWMAMTQNGSNPTARTLTDTGVNSLGVDSNLEMRSLADGSIEFIINGIVVANHTTKVPLNIATFFKCGTLSLTVDTHRIDIKGMSCAVVIPPLP